MIALEKCLKKETKETMHVRALLVTSYLEMARKVTF